MRKDFTQDDLVVIITMVAQAKGNKEISEKLGRSNGTIWDLLNKYLTRQDIIQRMIKGETPEDIAKSYIARRTRSRSVALANNKKTPKCGIKELHHKVDKILLILEKLEG